MCSALVNSIQGQMISSTRKEYIKSCQPEGSKSRWYVIKRTKRSFKEEILLISQLKFSSWHFINFCVSPKMFPKLAKFTSETGKMRVMQNLQFLHGMSKQKTCCFRSRPRGAHIERAIVWPGSCCLGCVFQYNMLVLLMCI